MDEITIKLPAKPEYISVARLTTAAIANRNNFTIDEIEDLKVAVSEAGSYLINQFSNLGHLTIDFQIHGDTGITALVRAVGFDALKELSEENELSLFIIESVSDKVTKETDEGIITGFSILKTGGGNLEHK